MVKKPSGQHRFCADFHKINAVTRRDAYPLHINNILDRLRDARYLSSIDIKSAYWQIPLQQRSREKFAFTVPGRALFQFTRMPIGLNNAPAIFQRFIDRVFGPEVEPHVFCYLNDIIILTKIFKTHMSVLETVFEKLLRTGLSVNKDKCDFMKTELKYLGYVVDADGLHTDPAKIESMLNYPSPKTVKDVRSLLVWYHGTVDSYQISLRVLHLSLN